MLMPSFGHHTAGTATRQDGITEVIPEVTIMERKREALTQNLYHNLTLILLLHQNQIQKEDLRPMPKPIMPIMDTTQHGTPHIPIHTMGATTMERKREVLTQSLHQNQIQREDLKLMPKPGTPIMDTIPHGITQDTMVTTHTTIMESNKF